MRIRRSFSGWEVAGIWLALGGLGPAAGRAGEEVRPPPKTPAVPGEGAVPAKDGKAGIEALMGRLSDPDWTVRRDATAELAAMGSEAIPRLEARVEDPDPEIAWRCQEVLAALKEGLWLEEALRALRKREWEKAKAALGKAAKTAGEMAPRLSALAEDVDAGFLGATDDRLAQTVGKHNICIFFWSRKETLADLAEEARKGYLEALEDADEDDARSARLGLAALLAELGRKSEAKAEFKKVSGKKPETAAQHLSFAYVCSSLGDFDKAVDHIQSAALLKPMDVLLYLRRTNDFYRMEKTRRYEALIRWLEGGLDMTPQE